MNSSSLDALPLSPVPMAPRSDGGYSIALGRLRTGLTALVVAHHAVLAYHPWAPPAPASLLTEPRYWQAFPVSDPQRWSGWAWFVGFNDTFFMALMFLVSGVFVWDSLQRKGTGRFLRDRFVRLGLPFLAVAAVVAPLAYLPTYLQSTARGTSSFFGQWLHLGTWPAGPAWFLWMLLGFGVLAAGLHAIRPRAAVWEGRGATVLQRPIAGWALLVAFSALAFIPLAWRFGGEAWTAWGPFVFQTSRPLHYGVYFAAGVVLGGSGIRRTFLTAEGSLARRWLLWVIGALFAFAIATVLVIAMLTHPEAKALAAASALYFCVSCATSSWATLAVFLRFSRKRSPLGDSLCASAYGIYLVHYPIVSWLQYALVGIALPGLAKGVLVTVTAIALSWLVVVALRRVRWIAAVI